MTSQSFASTFDNKNGWLYFDVLIRKNHKMDLCLMMNVELLLNFKITWESPQSDSCNSRHSQNTKRCQNCQIFLFLYLIVFHPLNILHFIFFLNHFKVSTIIQISSQFIPFDDWISKTYKNMKFSPFWTYRNAIFHT